MPLPVLWFSDRHPLIKGFTMRSIFFPGWTFWWRWTDATESRTEKKNRIAKTLEKTDHKIEATSLLLSRLTERKKQFLERKTVLHIRSKRPGTDPYKRIDRILETWNVLFKETISATNANVFQARPRRFHGVIRTLCFI